jgi:hypothetical protein
LTLCQGFGPHKAQRLHKVLHQTFKRWKQVNSTTIFKVNNFPDFHNLGVADVSE